MPITSILSHLSSGLSVEQVLAEWPELEAEDVCQALAYAAWAMGERVVLVDEVTRPVVKVCYFNEDGVLSKHR